MKNMGIIYILSILLANMTAQAKDGEKWGLRITKVDCKVKGDFFDLEGVIKNISNKSMRNDQFVLSARCYDDDDILLGVEYDDGDNRGLNIDWIGIGDGWRWSIPSIYKYETWYNQKKEIKKIKLQIINRYNKHLWSCYTVGKDTDIKIINPILVKKIPDDDKKTGNVYYYWTTKNLTDYGVSVEFYIKFWDEDDVPIEYETEKIYLDPHESAYNYIYCLMDGKEMKSIARYEFAFHVIWRYTGDYRSEYIIDLEKIAEGRGFIGMVSKEKSWVLCYVDLDKNEICNVWFDVESSMFYTGEFNADGDIENKMYVDSPFQGEEVVFLANNQKVGEGKVKSIQNAVAGDAVFGALLHYTINQGEMGDIVMSKSLFSAGKKKMESICKDSIGNVLIQNILTKELLKNDVDVNCLGDFSIIKKLNSATEGETSCMVTTEAKIEVASSYVDSLKRKILHDDSLRIEFYRKPGKQYSEEYSYRVAELTKEINDLKYIVDAILVKKNSHWQVEFMSGNPNVSRFGSEALINYCCQHNLNFIDIDGTSYKEMHDWRVGEFVDWLDVDRAILEYWGDEGGGIHILKKV